MTRIAFCFLKPILEDIEMKNKLISTLPFLLFAGVSVSLLASCGDEYREEKHTISFYDDETLISQISTAGEEEITLPAAPKKENFTFQGWYLDKGSWEEELRSDSFLTKPLLEDIDSYAYYEENPDPAPTKYTISFYIDDEVYTTLLTAGEELLTLPEAPKKDQYEFKGWFFDNGEYQNELREDTFLNTPLTKDTNVYAYYEFISETPEEFLVSFATNGGSEVPSLQTSYIEEEPFTEKEGYTFLGWYLEEDFLTKVSFPHEVTKEETLYAKWEKNTYLVHFELNGGEGVEDQKVSEIKSEPVPVKEGFTFLGWYLENTFEHKVSFPYEVTHEVTFYAKWEEKKEDALTFVVNQQGVLEEVNGISENVSEVEIPAKINGIEVKEIAEEVFSNQTYLTKLTLPDSVTILGYKMCYGCTNLEEVNLGNSITVIPDSAFEKCSSLRTISLPESLVQIRSNAFSESGLTELVAPKTLKEIWSYAFSECAELASVDFASISSIGDMAFENCAKLTSVSLPDSLNELGTYAFSGCTSLTDIQMPSLPISITNKSFYGTGLYNDENSWENGVLYIDNYLVATNADFSKVTDYQVKEGTIVIASYAFQNNNKPQVQTIHLPEGLIHIGTYAFSNLAELNSINIPSSVKTIEYNAFSSTGIAKNTANWENNVLYVGNWLVSVENVKMTELNVKEGTIGIADGKDTSLFPSRATSITSLNLPSTLKYIGVRSFARLKITSLVLPSSLESIQEEAFNTCSFLENVDMSQCHNLKTIGYQAFANSSIKEITIPESVTEMGELVFNHNRVDLTVYCEISAQPSTWNTNWNYSYKEGVTITVLWGQKENN